MLKQYFLEKEGGQRLLFDCQSAHKNDTDLTDSQKTQCVNILVDYGISVFGLNPLPHQYRLLALAAVDLIEGLKSKSGLPTVSSAIQNCVYMRLNSFFLIQDILVNTSSNGTSGRLYNRFRYLRQRAKTTENAEVDSIMENSQHESQQYSMDDLLYLKTVVVSIANMAEIRKRLEKTRQQRDEMVRNETHDLMEHFPFFFTCPQLVSEQLNIQILCLLYPYFFFWGVRSFFVLQHLFCCIN